MVSTLDCSRKIESVFGNDFKLIKDSLPFTHETINRQCQFNSQGKSTVLDIDLANTSFSSQYIWQYLSHTNVQFWIETDFEKYLASYLDQKFWFNSNNYSYSLLEGDTTKVQALIENYVLLFRKIRHSGELTFCEVSDFYDFPLSQVSVLNFQNKIVEEFLGNILEASNQDISSLKITKHDFEKGNYIIKMLNPSKSLFLKLCGIEAG